MKKLIVIMIVILTFVTSVHSKFSIGIQLPFSMRSSSHLDAIQKEACTGVYGTIEYNFYTSHREIPSPEGRVLVIPVSATPLFGIKLSGGHNLSLGGKHIHPNGEVDEYKNSGYILCILLKYYFPVSKESKFHLHIGCGPEVAMLTREDKVGNTYEKTGKLTNIWIATPVGFDYDITTDKMIKLTTIINFQYIVSSTVTEATTTMNYTLGIGLKRTL